jgi:hypothetical protein
MAAMVVSLRLDLDATDLFGRSGNTGGVNVAHWIGRQIASALHRT